MLPVQCHTLSNCYPPTLTLPPSGGYPSLTCSQLLPVPMFLIHCQFLGWANMIQLISKLQVSINERLDHISILTIDSEEMAMLIKDDEKKRNIVRNFRMIKYAEKARTAEENKIISLISKLDRKLSKHDIIVCEGMITNCINQYLNTEYLVHKSGEPNDLIDVFIFYYQRIHAQTKVRQMTVIRNMGLMQQLNFVGDNLQFFLANMQESMRCLYEDQKNKFLVLLKQENRSVSPDKRAHEDQEEERFDFTGSLKGKKKRQLQIYCFELSRILNLEHVYVDYFYFSSTDVEKRKKMLESNYLKRNVFVKKFLQAYEREFAQFRLRANKAVDKAKKTQAQDEAKTAGRLMPLQEPMDNREADTV